MIRIEVTTPWRPRRPRVSAVIPPAMVFLERDHLGHGHIRVGETWYTPGATVQETPSGLTLTWPIPQADGDPGEESR